MSIVLEVRDGDGRGAQFDVEAADGAAPERVSRRGDKLIVRLDESVDEALAAAKPAAEAVVSVFRSLSPDQVSVEFGLRLDAEAGAVFTKAGIGAHFTVAMAWNSASTEGDSR